MRFLVSCRAIELYQCKESKSLQCAVCLPTLQPESVRMLLTIMPQVLGVDDEPWKLTDSKTVNPEL